MGWKTGHARLTPREAKAQLLAITREPGGPSLIARYPWRSLAIALAAGFLFARTARFWGSAGSAGLWLLRPFLPVGRFAPQTPLDRLKARARRIG